MEFTQEELARLTREKVREDPCMTDLVLRYFSRQEKLRFWTPLELIEMLAPKEWFEAYKAATRHYPGRDSE